MARVRGACRICGAREMLDPHHIISQAQARKQSRPDLITNPGNVVHICRACHKLTTSYQDRERLEVKEGGSKVKGSKKAMREVKPTRCIAETGSGLMRGGRCRLHAVSGSEFCHVHNRGRSE